MAENYKPLYKQTVKMLHIYHKEIIPRMKRENEELRSRIQELESTQRAVTRCEDCSLHPKTAGGYHAKRCCHPIEKGSFCSYGVKKEG